MFEKKPSRWSTLVFRAGIALLIKNKTDRYLACKRTDGSGWQCVQGGLDDSDLDLITAAKREATEELGVEHADLTIVKRSSCWRRYHFPQEVLSKGGIFEGQDQMWLLGILENETAINLAKSCGEFSDFEFVTLNELMTRTVPWKRMLLQDFCRELGLLDMV